MLKNYFDDLTADLSVESERIRKFFATHKLSAGENREGLVAKLLAGHLIPSATIETGLILASSGEFSNQSDVVLVDSGSNRPLHGHRPIPLWLVEATYGVIEVKTQLTPATIKDAVDKCVRYKKLPRKFQDAFGRQKLTESLFCIWAFDAPAPATAKSNLEAALSGLPQAVQPDFVICPGRFLVRGGHYLDLSTNGQIGSEYRKTRLKAVGGDVSKLLPEAFEMLELGANTLPAFLH
jgi:hypothetical protein